MNGRAGVPAAGAAHRDPSTVTTLVKPAASYFPPGDAFLIHVNCPGAKGPPKSPPLKSSIPVNNPVLP